MPRAGAATRDPTPGIIGRIPSVVAGSVGGPIPTVVPTPSTAATIDVATRAGGQTVGERRGDLGGGVAESHLRLLRQLQERGLQTSVRMMWEMDVLKGLKVN